MPSSSPLDIVSSQQKFEATQLPILMEAVREKYPNCEVLIQTQISGKIRQRVVVFQQGQIGFCGDRSPKLDDFVDLLRRKINPDWINRIFESSQINLNEEMTAKQFCDRLLQMRVIQKGDLLKAILSAFLLSLEPVWSASGTLTISPLPKQQTFTLVEWRIFKAALEKRQQIWQNFSELNRGICSIPTITEAGFQALQNAPDSNSDEGKLIQFIEKSIDGRNDIVNLAKRQNVDPLSLAQPIIQGIKTGWLSVSDDLKIIPGKKRKNILVIDDNPTTRKLLVTILQEFYEAHATSGSLIAMSLVPAKKIDLIIVAQSIPTGLCLQLCKVIRQNNDYQHMPFLVIGAKENFFERAKAKMVGVTDYLTQPLDRKKILHILESHLT